MSDKILCPHCGDELLWSEDRDVHCDGCERLTPEDIIRVYNQTQGGAIESKIKKSKGGGE